MTTRPPQARSGTGTLLRGGSRLKLELSNESITQTALSESPNAIDSSKAFTPSRIMATADGLDLGDMSPHPSARGLTMMDITPSDSPATPCPMPRRRRRFAVPDTRRRRPQQAAPPPVKKDGRPKPWTFEVPGAAPRYQPRSASDAPAVGGSGSKGWGAGVKSSSTAPAGWLTQAHGNKHADVFPWTGDHLEDQFSDSAIRSGYAEKGAGLSELSSAKNLIFQILKQKRGLHELSGIFTGMMEHRRKMGEIESPTTFKLPLRVALTDTKREAWLKDLANPSQNLRRLSRTIPHGISRRVLLDQCLNKRVPTERAVWLTRCVGANEIRATRRKGPNGTITLGGEVKWNREWTVNVEQFVEQTVFTPNVSDWKLRAAYALRLARHLFYERLLDREHYAEWLISGLESTTFVKIAMWLLLVQIHVKDLLCLRKTGRRLVGALLNHHLAIQTHPDRDLLQSPFKTISSMLCRLMTLSPENFVSPATWPKYQAAVQAILSPGDVTLQSAFRSINSRNEQLTVNSVRSQPAARSWLVKILDSTISSPIPKDLSLQCWGVTKDKTALARALLEWSTSLQRPGLAKVYLAASLLKSWGSSRGLDITTVVLQFLDTDPVGEAERKELVFRLVSELVRAEQFSVVRYTQWLIARGGLTEPNQVDPDGPCVTRLLVEVPTNTVDEFVKNLRTSMLRRASYPVASQAQEIEEAIEAMKQTLGFQPDRTHKLHHQRGTGAPMSLAKYTKRLSRTSCGVKLQVGYWLRNAFVTSMDPNNHRGNKPTLDLLPITLQSLRSILECCQDFAMLADVLKVAVTASNAEVLAACCDTVNLHLQTFGALGVAKPLFEALMVRLSSIAEEQGPTATPLLASLASLAARMPGKEELAAKLSKELRRHERSSAVDACSPVSDNNAEVELMHEDGAIEKLLASGTSLDKHTMDRLFANLVGVLHSCQDKEHDRLRACVAQLTRLRLFDEKHFDALMTRWIQTQGRVVQRTAIASIYPLMVSLGCLSIPLILAAICRDPATGTALVGKPSNQQAPSSASSQALVAATYPSRFLQEVLHLVICRLPSSLRASMMPEDVYRFRIAQSLVARNNPTELLTLFRNAIAEFSVCQSRGFTDLPLERNSFWTQMREPLKELVIIDVNAVARIMTAKHPDRRVLTLFESEIDQVLIPGKSSLSSHPEPVTFEQILELTNEFTLPFCQLKLAATLSSAESTEQASSFDRNSTSDGSERDRLQSRLEKFARAMDKAIDDHNVTWTGMLSCLSPEITQHLKNRAQARFLELLPSARQQQQLQQSAGVGSGNGNGRSLSDSIQMAETLVSVVDTIIRGGSMGRAPQLVPAMVDRLTDLWELLSASSSPPRGGQALQASDSAEAASGRETIKAHWLPHLLTFMTLHTATFDSSKASTEVRAKAVLALAGIMLELSADASSSLSAAASASASSSTSSSSSMPSSSSLAASLSSSLLLPSYSPLSYPPPQPPAPAPTTTAGPEHDDYCGEPSLSQRVFDLALVLADSLPEDARSECARVLADATTDARVRYLASCPPEGSDHHWLVVGGSGASGAVPPPGMMQQMGAAVEPNGRTTGSAQPPQQQQQQQQRPGVVGGWDGGAAAAAGGGGLAAQRQPQQQQGRVLMGHSQRFVPRRWELLHEPTPNIGENDGSLSLTLFKATKLQ